MPLSRRWIVQSIHLVREANASDEAFTLLIEARYKSFFLFDQDIADHIEDILEKAKEIRMIYIDLNGDNRLPVGEKRSQLARRKVELLNWNYEQMKESPQRYSKYLKFK